MHNFLLPPNSLPSLVSSSRPTNNLHKVFQIIIILSVHYIHHPGHIGFLSAVLRFAGTRFCAISKNFAAFLFIHCQILLPQSGHEGSNIKRFVSLPLVYCYTHFAITYDNAARACSGLKIGADAQDLQYSPRKEERRKHLMVLTDETGQTSS